MLSLAPVGVELVGCLVTLAGVEPVDKARRLVPADTGGGFVVPLPPKDVISSGDGSGRRCCVVVFDHRPTHFVDADAVGVAHRAIVQ